MAVIKLYHHRATREELSSEVPIRVQSGMLSDLLEILDNRERRLEDRPVMNERSRSSKVHR